MKSYLESIKTELSELISKYSGLSKEDILNSFSKPPSYELGDISFPCFSLAKIKKKNPNLIAQEITKTLKSKSIEKINSVGGYVNFYFNRRLFSNNLSKEAFGKNYGTNESGKGKKIVIEMSSPNIAKPFGIGHLRSTVIGESLSRIYKANGYQTMKINYLGDWGTQFGKLIYAIKKWGDKAKLKNDINYLQELYIKATQKADEKTEEEFRNHFKKMEQGDKESLELWKNIRKHSLEEFNKVYALLGVSFDKISGESEYNKKSQKIVDELLKKKIAKQSEGSIIVDLESEGKSIGILRKSDGTTIYLSRDIASAIDRKNKYDFDEMIYEVGSEQKLHFQQLFTILEKMGYKWSKNLKHISHGLYLGTDGKKLSTRQGSSIKMKEIWDYTYNLVLKELEKRQGDLKKTDFERAKKITRSAIIYGDVSNYRENDIRYDINSIVSMEGDTGPYLLYSYARCKSILRKLKYKREKPISETPDDNEYKLISKISEFPDVIQNAKNNDDPSAVAKYSMELAREFNSFYTQCRVKSSEREKYRSQLIDMYSSVLKNSLNLLGIETLERM